MPLLHTPLPLYRRDSLPTPRWLIDGILPEAELVLLDGPAGVGKSLHDIAANRHTGPKPSPYWPEALAREWPRASAAMRAGVPGLQSSPFHTNPKR